MADGPYSQSPDAYGSSPDARKSPSYADKIAERRQERFDAANPEQAESNALKAEVAELKNQIAAIWTLLNSAHGAGGINVAWPVIAYTAPAVTVSNPVDEGTLYGLELCDGTTLSVKGFNIVAPLP